MSPIGIPGYYFTKTTKSVLAGAANAYVLPAGKYNIITGTNTKLQRYDGSSWIDLTAADADIVEVESDGVNFRLLNGHATDAENSDIYLNKLME